MQTELDLERNPAPDDPEPLRLARAFVQGGSGAPTSLPDEVADAMVDILVRRRDSEKLTRLAATAGKDMAKRARRGLHLLRSRGIAVEVPRREPPLIQQAQQKEREPERTSLISLPGG